MLILSHLINKRTHSFNPEHHTGHKRKENNKRMEDKILKINRASEWQSLGGTPAQKKIIKEPTRLHNPAATWNRLLVLEFKGTFSTIRPYRAFATQNENK